MAIFPWLLTHGNSAFPSGGSGIESIHNSENFEAFGTGHRSSTSSTHNRDESHRQDYELFIRDPGMYSLLNNRPMIRDGAKRE